MKIGLFFGSFNPIHTGHLIIASTILNELPLEQVWFVVSPQNPLKENASLLPADKRFMIVAKAIEGDSRFLASDVEFNLPTPSYTIDTLQHLEKHYLKYHFYLVMGSDSYLQLEKWKGYKALAAKDIIVYERPGALMQQDSLPENVTLIKSPLLNISATEIRALVKAGKSIKYLVPEVVEQMIDNQSFYK